MSQVRTHTGFAALMMLAIILLLAGCSDPNAPAKIFDPETGKHIPGWLPAQHAAYATNGTTSLGAPIPSTDVCTGCHGADLSGGISNVSCSACHMGGPTAVHPADWNPIYLTHGPSASANGTAACANQYCHGAALTGVANSGPSCDKNAGIGGCHSVPYDPASVICSACHRIPPDGSAFPNLAGKHSKHSTSNTASCDICHNGASSYVGDHHNGVINFSFLPAYTPKTGLTPSFNTAAKTCTNISCHGGQAAPSWYTGGINVNTQCLSCHAFGTTQYNSFSSGEHDLHVNGQGFACTECHDTTKLAAVHFNDLNTSAMGQANLTLLNALNYVGGSCTINCHGESHNNRSW